jgi:thiol-disulfide isomerase/thioredoxin
VDLGPPVKSNEPNSDQALPAPPQSIPRTEDIATRPLARSDPIISIPSVPRPAVSATPPPDPVLPLSRQPRIPSCTLVGSRLHDFALYDLNLQPWEFSRHRRRLILLDFWATWCTPCKQAIWHLAMWQERFRSYGFEVIGIAYEQRDPWNDPISLPEQAKQVDLVRRRLSANYQMLLGGDSAQGACPVRTQFAVRSFPTLVLLDGDGKEIRRWQGGLDSRAVKDIELIIEQQLGLR